MAAVVRIYGSTADAYSAGSTSNSYATARGSTNATNATVTSGTVGQSFSGSLYTCHQSFLVFDTSGLPAGCTRATLSMVNQTPGIVTTDLIEFRAATTVANKIAGANLAAMTPLYGSGAYPTALGRVEYTLDITSMPLAVNDAILMHSSYERLNVAPTANERASFASADAAGTTDDPYLDVTLPTYTFVGVSPVVESTTTTLTLAEPVGVVDGDLMVACIASRSHAVIAASNTGWTVVNSSNHNSINANVTAQASATMLYRIRNGVTDLSFTLPTGINVALGCIVAYRGVAALAPLDASTAAMTPPNTYAVSLAGLTTTQPEDLIVVMTAGGQEAAWSGFNNVTGPLIASGATNTSIAPMPTVWTERADVVTTTLSDTSLGVFDSVKATAGATGNLTVNASVPASHVIVAGAFKVSGATSAFAPGQTANAAVGTVLVSANVVGNIVVNAAGQVAASALGTAVASAAWNVSSSVAGAALAAAAGTVTVAPHINVSVSVTGQSAAAALGSATVSLPKVTNATGVAAATAAGSVTVNAARSVSVDAAGAAAQALSGGATVSAAGNVSFGVSSTALVSSLGTVSVTADRNVSIDAAGAALAASVGGVTVTLGSGDSVNAAGAALVAGVGTPTVVTKWNVAVAATGVVAPTALGTANAVAGNVSTVNVTGFALHAAAGTVEAGSARPLDAWDWKRVSPHGVTLSDGDTLATVPAGLNAELWSMTAHNTSYHYVEVTFDGDDPDGGVGLFDDARTNGAFLRADGVVDSYAAGDVTSNPTFPSLSPGDVVGIALNSNEGKVWFRVNGGNWNNDPSVTGPSTGTIPRPHGVGYVVPGYGTPYSYPADVPVPNMKWSTGNGGSAFANSIAGFAQACNAARAANLPLVLDVAQDYPGVHASYKLPSGLYGRPGVRVVFTGATPSTGTPCFAYLTDRPSIIKGIEFVGFGHVFGMSTRTRSVERGGAFVWSIPGSGRSGGYGTRRCIDLGTPVTTSLLTAGVGVPLDYAVYDDTVPSPTAIPTVVGPAIWISDNKFTNCDGVFLAWSDWIGCGRVDFHRNILEGTYGGIACECSWYTEIYAVNNIWRNCDDDHGRRITNQSIGRHSTFITGGYESGLDTEVSSQKVYVANNEALGIEATTNKDGVNAGVFTDLRNVTPTTIVNPNTDDPFTYWCDVEVSFNRIVGVVGMSGQEDSNAFYWKSRGFLMEGNYVEGCGSTYFASDSLHNGPESSGLEFKECGLSPVMNRAPAGAMCCMRGNEWVNQPPKLVHDMLDGKGAVGSVCGSNNAYMPICYVGEIFRNDHILDTTGNVPTIIRHYDRTRFFKAMCCEFHNCNHTAAPAGLIGLHAPSSMTGTLNEFSNNSCYSGPDITYTGDTQLILGSDSDLNGSRGGFNKVYNGPKGSGVVVGNMTSQFSLSSTGVPVRTYTRPTV